MHVFYENLATDDAIEIEQLSRLLYEIRVSRDALLAQLGAASPEQALARIAAGELPEHPAYEHYLSLRTLADLHSQVRADLAERLKETNT